jgi:hypothetical protein
MSIQQHLITVAILAQPHLIDPNCMRSVSIKRNREMFIMNNYMVIITFIFFWYLHPYLQYSRGTQYLILMLDLRKASQKTTYSKIHAPMVAGGCQPSRKVYILFTKPGHWWSPKTTRPGKRLHNLHNYEKSPCYYFSWLNQLHLIHFQVRKL